MTGQKRAFSVIEMQSIPKQNTEFAPGAIKFSAERVVETSNLETPGVVVQNTTKDKSKIFETQIKESEHDA
jgi:hypothetical protein